MKTVPIALRHAVAALFAGATFVGTSCTPDDGRADDIAALEAARRQLEVELAASHDTLAELETRVSELELENRGLRDGAMCEQHASELSLMREALAREQDKRLQREREWLAFTESLGALQLSEAVEMPHFAAEVAPEPVEQPTEPTKDPAVAAREKEIHRSLRTLLNVEGVRGIDLLESGELGDGWIGPVVFRVLDERGRLAGGLSARRLRLEGSRAARTVSIVLEDGFESRNGVQLPFDVCLREDGSALPGGARRIELPDTDPMPWVSALAELFGDVAVEQAKDDGLWNTTYVVGALNRLLREDASNGYWRVKSLGGVTGIELREVHLESFDRAGKLDRRVVADALEIVPQDRGFMLVLRDGAQLRGDQKVPFLDGRYRIYLPRASDADWRAAGLPGLAAPNEHSRAASRRSG